MIVRFNDDSIVHPQYLTGGWNVQHEAHDIARLD